MLYRVLLLPAVVGRRGAVLAVKIQYTSRCQDSKRNPVCVCIYYLQHLTLPWSGYKWHQFLFVLSWSGTMQQHMVGFVIFWLMRTLRQDAVTRYLLLPFPFHSSNA